MEKQKVKTGDWIIECGEYSRYLITKIGGKAYWKNGFITQPTINADCNSNFLTIKPKSMQENTVIHCPEKWMAEALLWSAYRLGYKWCNGESYMWDYKWSNHEENTYYNILGGTFGSIKYDLSKNYKIVSFWDAVCGEETTKDILDRTTEEKIVQDIIKNTYKIVKEIKENTDRILDNEQTEKLKNDMPKGPENTIIKEHKETGEYCKKSTPYQIYNKADFKQTKGENMDENRVEKEYEWCEAYISVYFIMNNAPECKAKDYFKVWCFDRNYEKTANIESTSMFGKELLEELHKPERKAWLDFAIEQGYVKEIEPEETFKIGDVIELENVSVSDGVYSKNIINICTSNMVCLNAIDGCRWVNMFSVTDVNKITYDEIYKNIKRHFKKVGHGAKDLI